MTKKQNFSYTRLNIGSTKFFFGLNKINCPKITSLSSRQTKIQQDKLQIRSKKLTTKQSIIKTNKKPQIPKIFTVSFSFLLCFFLSTLALRLSHSFSPLLLSLAAWLKLPFLRSKSSDRTWSENSEEWGLPCQLPFFFRCCVLWHSVEWVLTFEFWGITYKAWLSTLDLLRGLGCGWTFHTFTFGPLSFFFFFFWL